MQEETGSNAIPITAEAAFEVSDQIREYDLGMARMRYQDREDQKTINTVVAMVTAEVQKAAALPDPEKKLSSEDKRKAAVQMLLDDMPLTSEYCRAMRSIEDRREQLIFKQIERDHLAREYDTINAFAQRGNH